MTCPMTSPATCPICLETDNECTFSFPCKHKFHSHCAAKYIICSHWNNEDSKIKRNIQLPLKCPYCRQVPNFDKEKINLCSLTQIISLRDYFNQRMLDNINLYANLNNIKSNKFIVDTFNNNSITSRGVREIILQNF